MLNGRGYYNVCWCCKNDISSEINERCSLCGWYICTQCGACERYDCVGSLFDSVYSRKERKISRLLYSALPEDERIGVKYWLRQNESLVIEELKRINEAEEQERVRKQQEINMAVEAERKAKELERATYIANIRARLNNCHVSHASFGEGVFESFYFSGKFEFMAIRFACGVKSFVFPDAIQNGFLGFADDI